MIMFEITENTYQVPDIRPVQVKAPARIKTENPVLPSIIIVAAILKSVIGAGMPTAPANNGFTL